MMTRLRRDVTATQIAITIVGALAVAGITGAVKFYDGSKLDTPRFVAESISTHFEQKDTHRDIRELRGIVLGIDSTVKRIERTHR